MTPAAALVGAHDHQGWTGADSSRPHAYLRWSRTTTISDEPTITYSELDGDGEEVRKVEVYADARADRSRDWDDAASGRGLVKFEEINSYGPFKATFVSKDEFERA